MSDDRASRQAKRKRKLLSPPFFQDADKMYKALTDGTDLTCALVGTSYLDALLGSLLKEHLGDGETAQKMLNVGGVLWDFQNRADLAYCVGLVTKERHQDLSRVAMIRNRFAHSPFELDFGDEDTMVNCEKLHGWREFLESRKPREMIDGRDPRETARRQFVFTIALVCEEIRFQVIRLHTERPSARR